ncbi:3-keto-disaccharide hydrolase [Paludisphaera rhizosphaerae]|uniref:3-keto-disaccharide hydrolase n=1 Tax=Paludisphaera rhizosphaerae TaxID=2711216 RepID=UPI0013EBAC4F|nr:DUF1080 domain-containing protein [Paludisphaera rhizosphaerae]
MNSRRWPLGTLAALAISMGAASAAQAQEWVSLFDGKTLSGWTVGGGGSETKWEVVDGEIRGSGKASMLYSPKTYKNFKYRAEVKINDHGNSGLYFRSPTNKGNFVDGYEAQIDSTHTDPIRTGSLYGFVHVYKKLVPPDTWFTYEIECVDKVWRGKPGAFITIRVNGEELYQFMDFANTWKDGGYFAFQQHDPGSKVSIRKIEVQELP